MSLQASGSSSLNLTAIADDVFNPYDLRSAWMDVFTKAGMPDGDGDGSGDGSGDGDGDGDGSGSGGDGSGSGDGSTDTTSTGDDIKDPEKKRLSDEAAKYRNERNQLKAQLDELATWKKQQEDKDKSDLEKAESDRDEFKQKAERLEGLVKTQAVELAFFKSGAAAQFRDPEVALTLLDLSDVEPDDDGKVDGKAIATKAEALLKQKSYLKADDSGDEDDPTGNLPSGRQTNGKRGRDDRDMEALQKKFPALRGR